MAPFLPVSSLNPVTFNRSSVTIALFWTPMFLLVIMSWCFFCTNRTKELTNSGDRIIGIIVTGS